MAINLYDYVASIPDYPEKGIVFRDILPLMANGVLKPALKKEC